MGATSKTMHPQPTIQSHFSWIITTMKHGQEKAPAGIIKGQRRRQAGPTRQRAREWSTVDRDHGVVHRRSTGTDGPDQPERIGRPRGGAAEHGHSLGWPGRATAHGGAASCGDGRRTRESDGAARQGDPGGLGERGGDKPAGRPNGGGARPGGRRRRPPARQHARETEEGGKEGEKELTKDATTRGGERRGSSASALLGTKAERRPGGVGWRWLGMHGGRVVAAIKWGNGAEAGVRRGTEKSAVQKARRGSG
uniref:Uncharacterized protein n=1 Tax=Oryza sativa subsp. japonica TaxID=39947 RepID=Q5TKC0_ORYSJ|nr:hypothetical protein [Oryza sativa Japonica Group]